MPRLEIFGELQGIGRMIAQRRLCLVRLTRQQDVENCQSLR